MLKRLLPLLLLVTGGFLGATALSTPLQLNLIAQAQTDSGSGSSDDLYYTFYDQKILLNERDDQIAVQFVAPEGTRAGLESSAEPAFLQLQRDLENTTGSTREINRPGAAPELEISPLGDGFALITLPESATRSLEERSAIARQLQKPYIENTLPVLTREGANESIVVTREIVVSFAPDTTPAEAEALVAPYGLEVVRQLQFSPGRYLVRADAAGTAVLSTANQLENVAGIQSATPNFVQSIPYQTPSSELQLPPERPEEGAGFELENAPEVIEELPEVERSIGNLTLPNKLLPFQWYLNSLARRPTEEIRTDIYALEAWRKTEGGKDVTVAVIDSLMQWDHPDLVGSVYRLPNTVSDPLPGEVSGWDFSGQTVSCGATEEGENCYVGDPDTRISNQEIELVRPYFEDSIALSDSELLAKYPDFDEYLKSGAPEWSESERASYIRNYFQSEISAEFHGTWSAGVITALPETRDGMIGVAPNTKFLPVRVFGLGGSISIASLIEASGYAAARDVDVINFSLGGPVPNEEWNTRLQEIMAEDPNLVIVASAGNADVDRVSYPAAIPELVAVGATNLAGNRTVYSSYGTGLDVVAPGGETGDRLINGILTTGGTWAPGFWSRLDESLRSGGPSLDNRGQYVSVQGTSFAGPVISGIVALMKDVDDNNQLTRAQIVEILEGSADHDELALSPQDAARYQSQGGQDSEGNVVSAQEYFFGRGLVNAEVAVDRVKAMLAEMTSETASEQPAE